MPARVGEVISGWEIAGFVFCYLVVSAVFGLCVAAVLKDKDL
jgi:hypothetical protein